MHRKRDHIGGEHGVCLLRRVEIWVVRPDATYSATAACDERWKCKFGTRCSGSRRIERRGN